ncbi:MAG: hydantoinase B/oxoprolinase family protein [Planctomycetales bacterium]|nr:hydantoinase B/oxoprolinase family protein [Planctomycetales bacterium]
MDIMEAWIDVGGTFTDCFLRNSQGQLLCSKTLSSGRLPIACEQRGKLQWFSPQLVEDVTDFWKSSTLVAFDAQGHELGRLEIVASHEGVLQTSQLQVNSGPINCNPDTRFELLSGVEAPVLCVRRLLQVPLTQHLPKLQIRLGTTKGTNALLTQSGAPTALAITAGFEDLLLIGNQTRPDLFALEIHKPHILANWIVPIPERLDAMGRVLTPLDVEQSLLNLRKIHSTDCNSLAICLLHSYVSPAHELQVEKIAREVGFEQISLSSQVAPLVEVVARAETSLVDAYLSPVIRHYLSTLVEQFGGGDRVQLDVMTSAGGLTPWYAYSGKDSILSGPAGGIRALDGIRQATGEKQLLGLDMGGTSTDVCRVSNQIQLQFESNKAGVRILTPTLPIETVASGGGSICWFDGVALRVGPQSAGAAPGPACYGRGGPLTITDLNVFLGRIPDSQFPFALDHLAIQERLTELHEQVMPSIGIESLEELAYGLRTIANEQMAGAVRSVSIAQGSDPRAHALVGFGGAAGQHICEVAASLGIGRVFDSPHGGLLSALGMGLADRRVNSVEPVYEKLSICDWPSIKKRIANQGLELISKLIQLGADETNIGMSQAFELRYVGTDTSLTITIDNQQTDWPTDLTTRFHTAHQERFGYARPWKALELVAIRLEAWATTGQSLPVSTQVPVQTSIEESSAEVSTQFFFAGARHKTPCFERAKLLPGDQISGPAIILNAGSTLIIEPSWHATTRSDGTVELTRHMPTKEVSVHCVAPESAVDAVFRECFAARLKAIATQMGIVLQQTASSVNVKQRRDYSCAIFDCHGYLLSSAPHVPVHLGAMGQTVRAVMKEFPDMLAGDSFVVNDPYRGGSHLPDITVVTPVFSEEGELGVAGRKPLFYVANRAHHADVGGLSPGSMSITARKLIEEGIVISPRYLTRAGQDCSPDLELAWQNSRYPPRNISENLNDLMAQAAANIRGNQLILEYAKSESWERLLLAGHELLAAAAAHIALFIDRQTWDSLQFCDHLDDGTAIRVAIDRPAAGKMRIDFSGTGPTSDSNFNANPSIVAAAVIYVLRCIIADELPLNEGLLQNIELIIPPGCILNPLQSTIPEDSPAVAAGNVETSQRIVDVLLGAFGVAAASQGTMNNLLFGNGEFGFYETICGGSGATALAPGASAVHTHMTNTRLTDPEILESRYPTRLKSFEIRRGSGGSGMHHGGDGVIRLIEFLEPVSLSILSSRRGTYLPYGLHGGHAGAAGRNRLIRVSGDIVDLGGCCQLQVNSGDCIEIQTPGGGGYGKPNKVP